MAFLVAQGALRNAMMLGALLALAFAGIVMAGEWAKQDRISIAYLLFRYEMLKQLEDKAGVLFPIFHLEENFYKEGNGRITHFGFSQSAARWLPRMFGFLYLMGVSAVTGILIYVAITGQWAAWGLIWPH